MEEVMSRSLAFVVGYAVVLVLFTAASAPAAQFGTAEEAKAMLATMKGKQLRDVLGKRGFPLGQEMMQKATEGTIKEVTYWWPRPGSGKLLEKTSFYTKVGDQICGVGYYKG
jgi:hypothetical protein